MRRTFGPAASAIAALALLACHTITEDLPSHPSPIGGGAGIPVVSVPVPVLTPTPPVPSPSSPAAPAPNPRPPATPPPDDNSEPPTTNTSPVARLGASVYFIECDGVPVPGSGRASTAPVGCRVHLDCTPKDSSNAPTIPRGTPRWNYSNPGLITVSGNSPFNPVITGRGPGCLDIFAEVDGVQSDRFGVCFQ